MIAEAKSTVPRVSVITIFYNAERFLAEAVESVLAQHYEDYEIILVDDGSSDGSSKVARGYAEKSARVRYLEHPGHENRGMSASRNLGIDAARGYLIAFIDADDRWRPSKLTEQVDLLDRLPQVDLLCGAANYWSSWDGGQDKVVPTGHVQDAPVPAGEATLALYPLGKAAAPCPSDLIVRKEAALRVGCFESSFTGPLQMYEDQAFLAKIYLEASVYFASTTWTDYRQHAGSCVAEVSNSGRYDEVRQHFLDWFASYLEAHPDRRTAAIDLALESARRGRKFPALRRALRPLARALR
jgi:glycosyltransferase involved in cell wall biosynthesis